MKYLVYFLLLVILSLGIKILWDWLKARKSGKRISELEGQLTDAQEKLRPLQPIIDINAEVEKKKLQMELWEEKYARIKEDCEKEHDKSVAAAKVQADRIVADADAKAQETAGDALEAVRDAKKYESIVKAMQNTIKGYGNDYLVPNTNVIDELAEEYSYKEAGQQLKKAREQTRKMVKLGIAAECDYSEATRKQAAIEFVTDAFNGKAESVFSTAKHDNYGTLSQKLKDAFSLVNHAGRAFRNARITVDYLESRINELKWLVAVNELRLQEREEQKRIKQEMREEERARREYEKAMKQAAKEEELLEEAMAKAKEELSHASAEQKAQYEQQLAELEEKLKEAEEKNQRAISMAQQTRRGHVYVISNIGSFGEDVFKIGLTRRLEPLDRVKELGDASVPFDFDVHAMLYSEDAPRLEKELHRKFESSQVNKVNPRKEFFRTALSEIKTTVDAMDVESKWTMLAEAHEYRETLAVENGETFTRPKAPTPEEPKATEADNEDAPQEEAILPCPLCEGPLLMASLQPGLVTCPHCQGEFEAE